MMDNELKAPWKEQLGKLPFHLDYFQGSMYEAVKKVAEKYPDYAACTFMGSKTTYKKMMAYITVCAKALKTIGVRKGDKVTIALPNCPQAIASFYAINCIGAIANVVHPLSAEKELEHYVNVSGSRTVITLDQFYGKFEAIRDNTDIENLILTSVKDELGKAAAAVYMMTEGRKIPKVSKDAPVIWWKEFLGFSRACRWKWEADVNADDTAVILYSGGTTGTTKGVKLTNLNFNAHAAHIIATNPSFKPGDKMLAALPIFHGFGLGVCIHSMLANGGCSVLMPRFTADSYSKLMFRSKCNFLAGVPTLYEAMTRSDALKNANLSFLKGVYCGGDTLTVEMKKKIDSFLEEHGSPVPVREGYGATETVAAVCLTPPDKHKEGSIGLPFPDTYFKIVDPDTNEEMPYGQVGEIVINGPTVMQGYVDNKEETDRTLKGHPDGRIWCHTGDLGVMDGEGFIFFKGRIKRMIISSGYNIYPAQMEEMLNGSKFVRQSCVIGVPDSYRMHKIKAFVVLNEGYEPTEETWLHLMAYCKKHVARYSMPYDIEFRESLPVTKLGKIAYRELEEEELEKISAAAGETIEEINKTPAEDQEMAEINAEADRE